MDRDRHLCEGLNRISSQYRFLQQTEPASSQIIMIIIIQRPFIQLAAQISALTRSVSDPSVIRLMSL